jgi:5'-methylthioadenosine phosphorylase
MRFAIIGGTGLYSVGEDVETREVETPYGLAAVDVAPLGAEEVAFIARHGRDHSIPPHLVNYRANIAALRALGVRRVVASAAVGSLNPSIQPGDFALPYQFIDFTHGRAGTFFDGASEVRHVDMTTPYCPLLHGEMERAACFLGHAMHPSAVYVCTQGPRFETPAEIEMFRRLGGDVVGMTGVPEAPLAREAGLCYAALAVVTNWAAGMSQEPLDHEAISAHIAERMSIVKLVFTRVIESWQERPCSVCPRAAAAE